MNFWNICMIFTTSVLWFVELATNIACISVATNDHYYFYIHLFFLIVPSFVTNLLSWYCHSENNSKSKIESIIHLMLVGDSKRNVDVIKKIVTEKNDHERLSRLHSDAVLVSVINSLTRSVPIAILQMRVNDITGLINVVVCLFAATFNITSYHVSNRLVQTDKLKMTPVGVVMHYCWSIGTIVSRTISLFLVLHDFYIAMVGFVIHFAIMILFLQHPKIKFEREFSLKSKILLTCLVAFTYTFHAIPVRDGKTRYFYGFVYTLFAIENLVLLVYFGTSIQIAIGASCFSIGILFMILYYAVFHPSNYVRPQPVSNV